MKKPIHKKGYKDNSERSSSSDEGSDSEESSKPKKGTKPGSPFSRKKQGKEKAARKSSKSKIGTAKSKTDASSKSGKSKAKENLGFMAKRADSPARKPDDEEDTTQMFVSDSDSQNSSRQSSRGKAKKGDKLPNLLFTEHIPFLGRVP